VNATLPAIALNSIRVTLSGKEILRDLTASIPQGSLVGLVGPNGAGKSTLLRAATGHVPLSNGSVQITGTPLTQLSQREISRRVCFLPQNVGLDFPFTVREVVAMGRNPHLGRFQTFSKTDDETVVRSMRQATVEDLAERPVTELSGGEKQRVLLARSLATEAPILLLDEPMTSLDILHQLEVLELLSQFSNSERTIVAALHDLNVARRLCTHILLLKNGHLVAEGPPEKTLIQDHIQQVFGVKVIHATDGAWSFELPKPV
jgi:iron complex transport system ATP-binding protein